MARGSGTIDLLARQAGRIVEPLRWYLSPTEVPTLFHELGVSVPLELAEDLELVERFEAAAEAADELADLVAEDGTLSTLDAARVLAEKLEQTLAAAERIGRVLATRGETLALSSDSSQHLLGLRLKTLGESFTQRVVELLVVDRLERFPVAASVLEFFGVVDRLSPVGRGRLRPERLIQLLQSPMALLGELYGWGGPDFNERAFLTVAQSLLARAALGSSLQGAESDSPTLEALAFAIRTERAADLSRLVLEFNVPVPESLVLSIPIGDSGWLTELSVAGGQNAPLTLVVEPPSAVWIENESRPSETEIVVRLMREPVAPGDTAILLGDVRGSRLEAARIDLTFGVASSTGELRVGAVVTGGRLILDTSAGDGFVSTFLGTRPLEAEFDLGATWGPEEGLRFRASAGLEVVLPVARSVGPVDVDNLYFSSQLDVGQARMALEVAASLSGQLGPLGVVIDRLGFQTGLRFARRGGNLGAIDFEFDFKPPSAIGLSIDGQGIKGGGFLEIDPPNYTGVLELTFQDEIEVTAFGLITTKLPDGQPGFSLVISILAEFQPIQLGLGFALIGVGGLIGINRRMNEEALRETVKNHSLDAILFPTSPIRDAVKVIDAIKKILPPQEGLHVFGPMAQLIWGGSVTLVEFQLGIFIEIGGPVRIALIGQAKSELPDKKAPMVVLNMDLLGFIDFGKKTVAIDSSLFDSHIQKVKISGQMALRASWGEDADFAMSVGGFHPRFTPPPGFPALQRLAMTFGDGNPRIALTSYFAITTNSLQFGARLELWAKKRGFTVTGGLGFDALFIFHPFSFEIAAEAWVDVRRGGFVLLGVALSLTLSGPNPFRAKGYAKIRICRFLKIKVRFDKEFGKKIQQPQPMISPLVVLRRELEEPRNSRFELPEWASAMVVFAEGAEDRLDRAGAWVFSQNAVPLNLEMERFGGGAPPAAERVLRVEARMPGGSPLAGEAVEARFAPEQFHDWTVEEKLAAPAFESFESGLRLGGDLATAPEASHRHMPIEFETMLKESQVYLDSLSDGNPKKAAVRFAGAWAPTSAQARNWSRAGGQAVFAPRRRRKDRSHRNCVRVAEPKFAVASQDAVDGLFQPAADSPRKVSYSQAKRILRHQTDLVLRHATKVAKER